MWFQESVFDVYLDRELAFCSDEAEFICARYVNNQNEICWYIDSSRAILEGPPLIRFQSEGVVRRWYLQCNGIISCTKG